MPPEKRTLWNARLFVATKDRDAAHLALPLTAPPVTDKALRTWRRLPRYSMAMILDQADPAELIAHREVVSAALQTADLLDAIRRRDDRPVDLIVGRFVTANAYAQAERLLDEFAEADARDDANLALDQARAMWSAAQLAQRPDRAADGDGRGRIDAFMQRAFVKVAEASEIGHRRIEVATSPAKIRPGVEVTATCPVRLDLAGGWSDTPPYCFERGGHVVNVAIDLEGRPPVRAVVRTISEPKLVLESHDLGRTTELTELPGRTNGVDVRDPFALHKVALGLAGLLPANGTALRAHLLALGAGLHVTTESRVPKGSGLGTSSILAAALLAALHKLRGASQNPELLVEQTLLLEQRLSTGGGWQDQVGGIVGGVKSTTTAATIPQRPVIEPLHLTDSQYEALQERLVVYYSGQQRLARDILRRVMGRWLAREPAMRVLTESLKQGAAGLRSAFLRGRWNQAARHVDQYWQIKKELYPGSTTPTIDLLFLEMRPHYLAAGLAGAGGGGFAYFLCKDARHANHLRQRLADYAGLPGAAGNVYETHINRTGLTVKSKKVGATG